VRKIVVLSLVILVLGATAAYGANSTSKVRVDRSSQVTDSKTLSPLKSSAITKGLGDLTDAKRTRNCGTNVTSATLQCLNNQIKYLGKRTDRATAVLGAMLECMGIAPVNQYDGYVYTPDAGTTVFPTTALDFREEADTYEPDVWMLGWLCD
jgi:hypothetical protein